MSRIRGDKKLRLESKLSIRALAKEIGVSHAAISHWENETDRLPYYRAIQIAKICGHSEESFDLLVGEYSQAIDYKGECEKLLRGLDQKRLKAIHSVLLCLNFQDEEV